MHKLTKSFMHVWISLVSLAAFGIGWAAFAHSEKPAALVIQEPPSIQVEVPQLEPIPTLNDLAGSNPTTVQRFQNQNPTARTPRLRAKGS